MKFIVVECSIENKFGCSLVSLKLATGSTVMQALSTLGIDPEPYIISIWSKRALLTDVLQDGDRIELNRPLQKNPMSRLDKR